MQAITMIKWPAILQYAGIAELDYIHSQAAWDENPYFHASNYRHEDRLIDSGGQLFSLDTKQNGFVIPLPLGCAIALDSLLDLVRGHAAQMGQCCLPKISASSIADAIQLVKPD